MLLCYIDESGNTGNNLTDIHQPYLVLTTLLVPPEAVKDIENDIRDLSYRYFAAESRNTDFEFHGDDIYNARGRYFKRLSLSQRIQILDDIVDVVIKHEAIKIGYISIEKVKYFAKLHIQQTAFSLLVEKIEERLKGHLDSYGLLIADEQDEIEQRLIDDLDRFKQHGTEFGYNRVAVDRIIDSVHFVQSHNNYLMQLTDVICYLVRRGKEADKKLMRTYIDSFCDKEEVIKRPEFQEWLEADGHRGQRFFYQTYRKINKAKPWVFSKDFP
jgi:hypothetical protein